MELELLNKMHTLQLPEQTSNMGRPSAITQVVLWRLEQVFSMDCTVSEACLYAGISRDAFYDFINKYPDFSDRFKALIMIPVIMARKTIVEALPYSTKLAWWYLQRKRPAEFGSVK